ncbi:hypothetical protein SAMN05444166_1544 [Singulisphaera sp. GP187]|nr:hypothetical protein SAMN05444166_1544 [Singulisphaera sp. GP187]
MRHIRIELAIDLGPEINPSLTGGNIQLMRRRA